MPMTLLKSSSPPKRRWRFWVPGLIVAYTILGFLILPPIIRLIAVKQLSKQLDREVSIQKVKLNPYTLSATVRGLMIKDKDRQPFVSWDEVYVNFQLASFFGHDWVFKEITVTNPFVRVQVNKDYTLNFSDLVTKFSTNEPSKTPPKPSKPLGLRIDRLQIASASSSVTDLTPRTPFSRIVGPISVTLTNFRTEPDNKNPYSFTGTTDAGEKITWSGFFYLDPIRSRGEFALENLSLNKYAPLYQDLVRFEIRDGVADVHSTYRFELSATNRIATVTNTSFGLHAFKLAESGKDSNLVELSEFAVSDAAVDVVAHHAEVGLVSASGGKLDLRRGKDNTINVVELSKPAETATNVPGGVLVLLQAVTNAVALLLNTTNAWSGTIREVAFTNGAVNLEDLVNSRPARLAIDQVSLQATNISNIPGANLHAALSLRWNTNGAIKTEVTGSAFPTVVDVSIGLDRLELRPLDPYLESKVRLGIRGSKLSLDGQVHLRVTNSELPVVTFRGNMRLDDFSSADSPVSEDLLKWRSVQVSGIAANLNPQSVDVQEVLVDTASAHVIIGSNRTVNLLVALRLSDTNAPATEPVKTKTEKSKSKTKSTSPSEAAVAASSTNTSTLPKFSIARVVITNAAIRFTDRSVSPAVDLGVVHTDSLISGLSSEELRHADFKLSTRVDNVGPVEVSGTINPFGKNQTNDIKVIAKNVDLTPTSPYVGKFAGYRLAHGKLELDLTYHLVDRQIKAENKVVLDRFTFGEKVDSPEATKLPVKLAVAILKDREGKIKLDVPIEGSLDDPQFKLHKVIVGTIENILTKIATAPFAMLGSIFGGRGEELSFQEFAPGSAELQPSGKEKLDNLIKGLYERPALELEIEGSIEPGADRDGLRRVALDKKLRTLKWTSLSKTERAATPAEKLELTSEERPRWLRRQYADSLAKGEITPGSTKTNETATAAAILPERSEPLHGATYLMEAAKATALPPVPKSAGPGKSRRAAVADAMEQALLDNITIADSDFQGLAVERAKAVRQYVLDSGKVEAERIFLSERQGPVKTDGSKAFLQLR
jgi:hypothetical protein